VIGGLSGAMPPALGWAAIDNTLAPEAWLMVLIIFCWTPPHFWALSLYRTEDYVKSNLPMLPVTHGRKFTCLHIVLYTYILAAASILPYIYKMSGLIYLAFAIVLNLIFIYKSHILYKNYSDNLAKNMFKFSILYLSLLFLSLLLDHYIKLY
jgi:protoheme IX farnesyltransferase